jgi:hypothetical protein
MGGTSATGGMGGQATGGMPGVGGTIGTEGGAAGEGGAMGGEAGIIEPGTGGTGTGGTSGAGGTSGSGGSGGGSSGSSSGGMSGGGGSTSGAGGVSGAAAGGHGGLGGSGGGSTNLLTNGNFESGDTNGWTGWSTGTLQTSPTAHGGSYSALMTGRAADSAIAQTITSVVSVGHTYTVTGWVRASAATSAHYTVKFDCATANDAYTWVENPVNVDSSGWTQITGSFTFNTQCTGDTINGISLYLEGPAANIDVYMDDVSMTLN